MTHLSDTSYLDRLVANLIFFPLMLYYVLLMKKGFLDVRDRMNVNGTLSGRFLRFMIFSLYCIAYVTIIAYDILATRLKYEEGFVDTCLFKTPNGTDSKEVFRYPKHAFIPEEAHHTFTYEGPKYISASWTNKGNCGIKQTPSSLYTESNLNLLSTIDTLFNLSCTLRNSALFLLLAWFNTSIQGVLRKPILQRWEVRVCAFYSIFSLAWYFILPTMFSDPLISTISTQFLWSIELYVVALLLLMTNRRVSKTLLNRRGSFNRNSSDLVNRALEYALYANALLAFVCVGESTGLLVLNIDIVLMDSGKVIYGSKLLTDIWTRIFNFFFVLEPLFAILILYKPKVITLPSAGPSTSSGEASVAGTHCVTEKDLDHGDRSCMSGESTRDSSMLGSMRLELGRTSEGDPPSVAKKTSLVQC